MTVSSAQEKAFGKATAPLLNMLDEFPRQISNLPYHIFMDNLFTSFNVLKHLKDNGYNATGTIRDNRIPRGSLLPAKKSIQKERLGTCHYVIEYTDGIFICKWVENSAVSVASTKYGYAPTNLAKRYSRAEKKNIHSCSWASMFHGVDYRILDVIDKKVENRQEPKLKDNVIRMICV